MYIQLELKDEQVWKTFKEEKKQAWELGTLNSSH